MSRARELAKVGGKNQQVIAGLSSHVGVSTFAADVSMFGDLSVLGDLAVTGDLSYDRGNSIEPENHWDLYSYLPQSNHRKCVGGSYCC